MSYASGQGWQAVGAGVENIGRMVVGRRESERERREREVAMASLDAYRRAQLEQNQAELLQRRSEAGLRQRERKETAAEQRMRDIRQDWATRGVNVSELDINAAYGPGTGKMLAGTPQGTAAATERRGAMAALAGAAGASARGRSATTPGGSVGLPNISAVVAGMPPRSGGGGVPHPTVDQAMGELRQRYAQYDANNRLTGYSVPFEEMYSEALRLAAGGAPTPTPPPAPTLFDMGTPLGFPGAPRLRGAPAAAAPTVTAPRPVTQVTPLPAVTTTPAAARPAPRGSAFDVGGVPAIVRPAPSDTAGAGITPTQADSARAGGLIPVSQEEYAGIVAEAGQDYARRHFLAR